MAVIRRVTLAPYAIPLRVPLATARGAILQRRGVVVVLDGGAGMSGIGEAAPHPFAPATAFADTVQALEAATRWLLAADARRLDELLARAAELPNAAASGIDMALHDLAARAAGRSVVELLGGRRRAVAVSALLDDPADAAAVAARGFRTAKLKGSDPDALAAHVATARATAPELMLRVDANGTWDPDAAVRAARRLAAFAPEWIEQPVPADDVAGLRRVRREGGVAIAADEAVTGAAVVARLAGAADAVVLKLVQVGGLARARATAAAARRHGLALAVTTALDTTLGTAAALHLAASLDGDLRACGLATGHLLAGDLVRERVPEGPYMAPPDAPGLGVSLDPEALERWRPREVT